MVCIIIPTSAFVFILGNNLELSSEFFVSSISLGRILKNKKYISSSRSLFCPQSLYNIFLYWILKKCLLYLNKFQHFIYINYDLDHINNIQNVIVSMRSVLNVLQSKLETVRKGFIPKLILIIFFLNL